MFYSSDKQDESENTSESESTEGGVELYSVQRQRKITPSTWKGVEKVNREWYRRSKDL